MDRFFGFETQLFQIAVPERLGLDLVTVADQEALMLARQNAAQMAARQIHQGVEQFVADCVAALREQTAVLCDEMLQSISTSETGVHQKTLNRLVRFIDDFKQMNFVNDTDMEQRLQQVRQELLTRTAEEYRDSASARAKLVNGLSRLAGSRQSNGPGECHRAGANASAKWAGASSTSRLNIQNNPGMGGFSAACPLFYERNYMADYFTKFSLILPCPMKPLKPTGWIWPL